MRRARSNEEIENLDVTAADFLLLPLRKRDQKVVKKARALRRMETAKVSNTQADSIAVILDQEGSKALHLPLPIIIFLRRQSSESRQGLFNPRIQLGKAGEKLMTNPVTGKFQFVIAGIGHKLRADPGEIVEKFRLAVGEEGPDKETATPAHAGQAMQTAAATEMMQEGLRLIAAMMAEGNCRTPGLRRAFRQKSLARHPSRLFKPDPSRRSHGRDIDPLAQQRDLQLRAEGTDKIDVIATLRTNSVIEVGGNKGELQDGGNRTKKMEERNRIAATGEGHQDPFRWADQPVSMEPLQKIIDKPGG